jgi:hypothetical protein
MTMNRGTGGLCSSVGDMTNWLRGSLKWTEREFKRE